MKIWMVARYCAAFILWGCNVTEQTRCASTGGQTVSCNFPPDSSCNWENGTPSDIPWRVSFFCTEWKWDLFDYDEYCVTGYYRATAFLYQGNTGSKARLISSTLCSMGNIYYQLNFRYNITCGNDRCNLSVILQSDGSEESLWENTTRSYQWQDGYIDKIQPPGGEFRIVFQAERLSGGWARWIDIDNIQFKYAGDAPTTTSRTSSTAVPTTTTTFSTPVSSSDGYHEQTLPTSSTSKVDTDAQKGQEDTGSATGVVVGVAVAVIVVVIVAVIVILVFIRRKKNGKGCGIGSLQILHCLKKTRKPETAAEHVRPGVINAGYSREESALVVCANNADHLYAQVKKPKARNTHSKDTTDGKGNAAHTTKPDTSLYHVAIVPVGEPKTGEDGDYNTVGVEVARNTFPNNNGKDSGYELATASQTTAVHGGAKASLGGNNAHIQEQDEYNKLSHQPPHTAPSGPCTNHAYDHLAGQKQGEQTAGGVYSLAKADDFADGLSKRHKGKDDYINVNPDLTTTQSSREYNRLDFDDDHPRDPAAGGHVTGRARDVYNHLQAGAESSQAPDDGDQYSSLDFDGQNHKQQVIEGAEYSHLANEDA